MAIPAKELPRLIDELRRGGMLVRPQEVEHRLPASFPTGLAPLDRLLGGGLPEGCIVELGALGGAASALAARVAARFTREGRLVAWLDRGDAFDPRAAAEAGVELPRLLWCRPVEDREALRAADALLASGAFPLVVFDLRDPRQPKRRVGFAQGAWLRLARDAEAARASLLVLGEGAGSFAAATLAPVRRRSRFLGTGPGRTYEGMEVAWRLERNKLGLQPGEASLFFRAPSHFLRDLPAPAPGQKRVEKEAKPAGRPQRGSVEPTQEKRDIPLIPRRRGRGRR